MGVARTQADSRAAGCYESCRLQAGMQADLSHALPHVLRAGLTATPLLSRRRRSSGDRLEIFISACLPCHHVPPRTQATFCGRDAPRLSFILSANARHASMFLAARPPATPVRAQPANAGALEIASLILCARSSSARAASARGDETRGSGGAGRRVRAFGARWEKRARPHIAPDTCRSAPRRRPHVALNPKHSFCVHPRRNESDSALHLGDPAARCGPQRSHGLTEHWRTGGHSERRSTLLQTVKCIVAPLGLAAAGDSRPARAR